MKIYIGTEITSSLKFLWILQGFSTFFFLIIFCLHVFNVFYTYSQFAWWCHYIVFLQSSFFLKQMIIVKNKKWQYSMETTVVTEGENSLVQVYLIDNSVYIFFSYFHYVAKLNWFSCYEKMIHFFCPFWVPRCKSCILEANTVTAMNHLFRFMTKQRKVPIMFFRHHCKIISGNKKV